MAQPSLQDFINGVDLTNVQTVTGATLNSLVSDGTPFSDKGLFVVTKDIAGVPTVPDAATNTKWQTYGWLRVMASGAALYLWSPNSATDATYLNWINVNVSGIPAGSITGAMIALGTITTANVGNISASVISGLPAALPPNGNAGGDLTGVYPNPTIAANAVTGSKVTNVDANGILDSGIMSIAQGGGGLQATGASGKLKVSATSLYYLRTNAAGTANEYVNDLLNATAAHGAGGLGNVLGTAYQKIRINSGATAFEYWDVLSQTDAEDIGTRYGANGATSAVVQFAHGFTRVPTSVRAVIVCTGNDANTKYVTGDEIDIYGVLNSDGTETISKWAVSADAANINVAKTGTSCTSWKISAKDGSGFATVSSAGNFKVKVYYQP